MIIYDYEGNNMRKYFIHKKISLILIGYIKARENSIMDYVYKYDKNSMLVFKREILIYFILVQSSLPLPTIHFLSLSDCSQTLTKVAQTLCQRVKQGEIVSDSIKIDTIDRCYTSRRF